MRFILDINCTTPSFGITDYDCNLEVAQCLKEVVEILEDSPSCVGAILSDTQGLVVGSFRFEEERS